ncbi:serine hydrolase domain-containing protein [Myroides sp. LJL119]
MKLFIKIIVGIIVIGLLGYFLNLSYLWTAINTTLLKGHSTAFLQDYKYLPFKEVENDTLTQPWPYSKYYNKVKPSDRLNRTHGELQSVAFLVIKQDSIWHEAYYDDYEKGSYSNSFSMAKSIVTAALGKALNNGEIESLDQKVIDFLPDLQGEFSSEVTIGDLAWMSSGLKWDELYYSPFSVTTRAYFDKDLPKVMLRQPIVTQPGQEFVYKSGDTQLLVMVLQKATNQSLSEYVSKYFWKPMGAENPAFWQVDHHGANSMEKGFCCFTSNARDFARFGKLYKQYGKWNNQVILDSSYVAASLTKHFDSSPEYGIGWWLLEYKGINYFYMRGHLGQFVIVDPENDLIIVRLGHKKGIETSDNPHSQDLFVYIDEVNDMISRCVK